MMRKKKRKTKAHPWRDNIEAIAVSIVVIVLFKYFILEAYRIPTGSMQPTLMGWDGGIHDRVLVDKFSFHYRDPERFEIVVLRYPLDHSKNFIKRILGMPGEDLEIRFGDLFHGPRGGPLEVMRRPRRVQRAMLKRLRTETEWRTAGAGWKAEGRGVGGPGPGGASYPRTMTSIRDHYTDGYPPKLAAKLDTRNRQSGVNDVGDLRITCAVRAGEQCSAVHLELREGQRTYTLSIPGPAAGEEERPAIVLVDDSGEVEGARVEADEPWRLKAGSSMSIGGQNLDDLVELEIDGEVVARLEVPPLEGERGSRVGVASLGGGAEFRDLEVYRDIYYTSARQKLTRWEIPDDCYVMLGDNTQDSSDARDWAFARYEIEGEAGRETVRGNHRPDENPIIVPEGGGTSTVFLYDELGERRVFQQPPATTLDTEPCPYVPRELIRGRAVLVVWPLVPSLDVYRLQWVY